MFRTYVELGSNAVAYGRLFDGDGEEIFLDVIYFEDETGFVGYIATDENGERMWDEQGIVPVVRHTIRKPPLRFEPISAPAISTESTDD